MPNRTTEKGPNHLTAGAPVDAKLSSIIRRMGEGMGAGGTPSGDGLTPNPEVCSRAYRAFGCSSLQGVVQPEALSLWHPPGCGKLEYVSEFAFGFGRATMWG
jgi:hypothetical protein